MTSIGHTGCLQSRMFFTQLVLYVGSLKKKWQQDEQSKSQPFFLEVNYSKKEKMENSI